MKNNRRIILILIIVGVLVVGGAYYFLANKVPKPVACTMEAKLCPDGSAVGRTGPNCEFTACPIVKPDETADWKIYTNDQYGFEFKYPESFGANVWRPFFWPATTTVVSIGEDPVAKGCPNFPIEIQDATQEMVKINNIDYTLYTASDGALGSSYLSYCYVTEKDQKYYVIDFIIRVTNGCGDNCSVYCGTQYEAECKNFDLVRDVEKPIEKILSTFEFLEPDKD